MKVLKRITSSSRLIDQIIWLLSTEKIKVKVCDGGNNYWCGECNEDDEIVIYRNKWESPVLTLIHECLHRLLWWWSARNGKRRLYRDWLEHEFSFLEEQWIRDVELQIYRNLSGEHLSWLKQFLKNRGY